MECSTLVFIVLAATFRLSVMSACAILNNMATDTIESSPTCQPFSNEGHSVQRKGSQEAMSSVNNTHVEIKIFHQHCCVCADSL